MSASHTYFKPWLQATRRSYLRDNLAATSRAISTPFIIFDGRSLISNKAQSNAQETEDNKH